MKTKQILLLIVLVLGVGIGGLVLHQKQGAAWRGGAGEGSKLLPNLPVGEALAQIVIKEGTNTLTLAKQDDKWRVAERGGYPANYSEISSIVLKLRDLKPVQTEQIGASQLGRLQLLPPGEGSNTATRVEFRDASGKVLTSLLLGKTQMREESQMSQFGGGEGGYPVGRWVMVDNAKDQVALVSDPLTSFKSAPGEWLSKDFLKVEKIKSIAVTFPDATNSWSVSRTNETGSDWTLANAKEGETLDASKASGLGWVLSSPSFNDVETSAEISALAPGTATIIKLETFDHFTYVLKVGEPTGEDRLVSFTVSAELPKERVAGADEKPEDKTRLDKEFADSQKKLTDKLASEKALEKWTYLVPNSALDSLLKTRGELLQGKTEEAASENATTNDAAAPILFDGVTR
jgi:hypothetical protein